MSFIDSILELWDAQALTASEESRTNGDMLDMEEDGAVDAILDVLWLNILISTSEDGTCVSGGYFQLVTSDSATFATGSGGEQAIGCIGSHDLPLLTADLAAGKAYSIAIPTRVLHRYVELEWRVVSESAGAMVVDAWLGKEPLSRPMNTQKEPSQARFFRKMNE